MTLKETIAKLATETNDPCVTISLNTHRTHPDNGTDSIVLKNLLKEAEHRILSEYGKRDVSNLLKNLSEVEEKIDVNYNLDSMHIYLSNDTSEIIKSSWPTTTEGVQMDETFGVRPLMKMYNRSVGYLIMLVSQSGIHLFEALNDGILHEVSDDNFPIKENRLFTTSGDQKSDSKHVDDLLKEFLNRVDKAAVQANHDTAFKIVVVSTPDNYSKLMEVADQPSIYYGNSPIDYNHVAPHQLAAQSWSLVGESQKEDRLQAIEDVKQSISQGKVLTDLQEIFQASIDGRGELLIVHQDFSQAVIMKDDRTFKVVEDPTTPDAIDDIVSTIAWEVVSKKGKVIFTAHDEILDLGQIALKVRY
jgi:hypothetical protein